MIRTSAAALMLSTALITGVAVAQTNTTNTAPTTGGSAAGTGSTQFLTEQDKNQFRASKFVGLAIYGQDDQRIGDINEILIDSTGSAKAVVVGVGGFLGIGEKNVALPFSAVEWVNDRPASASAANSNAGAGNAGAGNAGAGNAGAGANNTAMTTSAPTGGGIATGTGTTTSGAANTTGSTTATSARSPAETAAANGYPDHGKIRMSKADLQNAPAFRYYGETNANRNTDAGGSGTAPRQ